MPQFRDDDPRLDDPGGGGRPPGGPPGGIAPGAGGLLWFDINQLRDIYHGLHLPDPTPDDVRFWQNAANTNRWTSLDQLRNAIGQTAEARQAMAPSAPPPGGTPGGGGGGGGAGIGSLYGPFGPFTGSYQPLQGTPTSWTNIPAAPQWKDIPTFTAPTMEQAKQEPGYAFGLQQGEQALTQDKAQQGLLYGGGTLKDILAWGQNYATQRYGDVYNRARDQFMTNTQNQYVLPYQAQMQQWQTMVPAAQRQNEFLTNSAYQQWLQNWNMWNSNRNFALDAARSLG